MASDVLELIKKAEKEAEKIRADAATEAKRIIDSSGKEAETKVAEMLDAAEKAAAKMTATAQEEADLKSAAALKAHNSECEKLKATAHPQIAVIISKQIQALTEPTAAKADKK